MRIDILRTNPCLSGFVVTVLLSGSLCGQVHIDKTLDEWLAMEAEREPSSKGSGVAQVLAMEAGFTSHKGLPIDNISLQIDSILKDICSRFPVLSDVGPHIGYMGRGVAVYFKAKWERVIRKISGGKSVSKYYPDIGIKSVDRLTRKYSGEYGFDVKDNKVYLKVKFKRVVDAKKIAGQYASLPEVAMAEQARVIIFGGYRRPDYVGIRKEGKGDSYILNFYKCLKEQGDFCKSTEERSFRLPFDRKNSKFVQWEEIKNL